MTAVRDTPTQTLVDPRVAKHGGSRRNSKANYDFPGMTDAASWRRTEVHKATHFYGCGLCDQKFSGPHAVYTHLAKIHDAGSSKGRTRGRTPPQDKWWKRCSCSPPPSTGRDFNGYGECVKCGLCPSPKQNDQGQPLCRLCERHPRSGDSGWCSNCLRDRAGALSAPAGRKIHDRR